MNKVYFSNNGILDPISITTLGVNAKDNDNAIGFFGTGLKYAIAVLLRENHGITIQSGNNIFEFSKITKEIRGKSFDIVAMNGDVLGFTTELGKNWKIWQAFREIYCNTTDENGEISETEITHNSNKTTICVTGDEFYQCFLNKGDIILDGEPIYSNKRASIYHGESDIVYYKNIKIYDGLGSGVFTYNIHSKLEITEDRTAKYGHHVQYVIEESIAQCKDKGILKQILLAPNSSLESDLNYARNSYKPCSEFMEMAEKYKLNPKANKSLGAVIVKWGEDKPIEKAKLNKVQSLMLDKAISFCNEIGYSVNDYPIIPSKELKNGLMGLALDEKIYIAIDCFGMGTKYLASTLIEEYLHIDTGYGDMTRELQSHLFNDIVSLGEQLIGEPV